MLTFSAGEREMPSASATVVLVSSFGLVTEGLMGCTSFVSSVEAFVCDMSAELRAVELRTFLGVVWRVGDEFAALTIRYETRRNGKGICFGSRERCAL